MGTLPFDKACFFMCLALIQTFTSAERQYFNHSNQYLTWDEARNYCQVCYKDLVAVNLDNVKVIIQMNEADHWIGLRKHFPKNDTDKNNTTSDMANNTTSYMVDNTTSDMVDNTTSDMVNNTNITSNYTKTPCKSWCKWSNEDPVIFQNWHAGMPVFKSRLPEIKCCSCSCTCPKSTTSVTTSSVSFTSSPSVQTTVMQYLPKSTDQIKGTNEGTSAKINHVPFTSSQAPRTTGAGTTYTTRPVGESITQMSGTKTTNEEENTTVKKEKTTMPTNPEIILKCTMKENTTPGQTTNQEGLSTVRESTTDLKNLRKTTNQEEFNTVGSSTTNMKHEENSTVRESTTGMKDLLVTTTQNGINTVGESTTDMKDLLKTTKQDGFNTVEEGMTDRDDLLDTTIQDDFSTAGESTTDMKDLSVTTTQNGINTVEESTTDMKDLLKTTKQDGFNTVEEMTTDWENLRKTTNQGGFSIVGERTTGMEELLSTNSQKEISTVEEWMTETTYPLLPTEQEGFTTVEESTTGMKDLSVPTTQNGINTVGESTTDMKDLLKTTKQDGFNTVEEGMTDRDDLLDTTIQDDFSTAGESTTDMKDLSVTTTQNGINTVEESTTDMNDLLKTTKQNGFKTVEEMTTDWENLRKTTNQGGFSIVGERTTGMEELLSTNSQKDISTVEEWMTETTYPLLPTEQEGFTTVEESTTGMEDLFLTTKQDGFNTVEEGMTDRDDLLDTTIQDDFSTAGESTTDMKDLLKTTKQVTTTKEGINTVRDSVADMENILVTTNKDDFSTAGESTTHWKGCETTNQEMSLTCELIKSMTDICNSSETSTPGEISTDSESTTVVTTNQEQQSTFKKSISFTTDKTTSSSITENTQEETTDPQRPDTSTNRATTFDTYESSTGSLWTTTLPSIEATCQQSPFETAILAEINENYIEDSCVVMTSFGTWVERRCSEVLPFICYEDRFFGQVNVTNVTSKSATLTWMPGPGHISHYIVQVNGVELNDIGTDLTLDLFNLTAGSHNEVKVFPVKCGRYLNFQNASFYTKPHRVNDLRVENTTDKSVHLRWNTTDGNNSLYIVKIDDLSEKVKTTYIEFEGLTPGVCYTFIVISTVLDESEKSEGSNITGCTKPAKVSNLHVTNTTVNSLAISWEMLEGNFTGFRVTVNDTLNITSYYVTKTELTITDLMSGTEISISVGALSNYNLMGDITNITNYTAPENIKDLILTSDKNSIKATWKYAGSSTVTFIITILEDDNICQTVNTKKMEIQIQNLKSSTSYIVRVHAVSGKIQSPEVSNSIFTLPEPPTNVRATTVTTDSISLEWNPPGSITKATYRINLTSIWNETYGKYVYSTSYKFTNLKSGTKYSFEVSTVAGDKKSRPVFFNVTTDADEREISLSMLCSTIVFPSCDKIQTTPILEQIDKYLKGIFEDRLYWNVAANN